MKAKESSSSARITVAFVMAQAAFAVTYLVGSILRTVNPWYYPIQRVWKVQRTPTGFAMEWYGRTATALTIAIVVGLISYLVMSRAKVLSRPNVVRVIAQGCGLLVLLSFVYFGFALMQQTPLPLLDCPR